MKGRELHFGETELTLRLKGLVSWLAVKRKVVMPYRTIRDVFVDEFDPPLWMLRMPGTSVPGFYVYEGSFKYGNEWYFLSFERRVPLLHIELDGHERYKYVIVQIDRPGDIAAQIRRRLRGAE
ncbi:hypothetical protein ACFQWB_16255 [Paenibacillus thermoaerophilus]|uniref:PH domain-containing protein n=1 Tax=Paenibacillus thermoaerophilus TaxID=1215385 RepID=A0ABW2V8A2_9BACL|nr:hypothetical protein [Paenibacillus thermoaerophilus]TMV08414.1 hypothetical protein FE781_15135 [Paenibacillus thermoaerophilus]